MCIRDSSDGQVLVTWGHALVYRFEVEDIGMRNLAIVALTDAGRRVDEVARDFDLTATYVSMLRGRARSVISDLLARLGPVPVQESLHATSNAEPTVAEPDNKQTTEAETETSPDPLVAPVGSARIKTGTYRCGYAGAMLLYPYLHQ